MKGQDRWTTPKIRRVSACFDGTFEARNRGLFMIGVSIGGRISELLSLQIGDVWQNGKAVTDLLMEIKRRGYNFSSPLRDKETTPTRGSVFYNGFL